MKTSDKIAVVIPAYNCDNLHRTLSSIVLQKDPYVNVYVVDDASPKDISGVVSEFEDSLGIRYRRFDENLGRQSMTRHLRRCLEVVGDEPWVCIFSDDNEFSKGSFAGLRRCMAHYPSFDVYHWNIQIIDVNSSVVTTPKKIGLKSSCASLFRDVFYREAHCPLSSFVFRTSVLRSRFVVDDEAFRMDLATVMNCAKENGIRTVRWKKVLWREQAVGSPEVAAMKELYIRSTVRFLLWSEKFFEEKYPVGSSDRLALYAEVLASLYPGYTPEDLKEMMGRFAAAQGALRKMKAQSLLKKEIAKRKEALQ